ncbi:MAG: PQQ-binding-like beta-propeller repeat protein [Planctomycetaceae bacterium]|nr:PQQ-binding-like beta-propeller repeat protein [Planctomycetaceae bacterium]
MKTLGTIGALALLALTARGDDWSHSGRDDVRTREPSETVDTPALFASVATGSETVASPVCADGYIVVAGLDGKVRAFRESDLAPVWTAPRTAAVIGTPLIDKGRVYVPFADGVVRILRLADGADLGAISTGGSGHASPLLYGGRLYIGAGFPGNALRAVGVAQGMASWSADLNQVVDSSPAIGAGAVLIAGNSGILNAFDPASGGALWSVDLGGDVGDAAPLVLGTLAYVPVDGSVVKVDLAAGSLAGTLPIGDPTLSGPPTDTLDVQRACSSLSKVGNVLVGVIRFDYSLDHAPQDGFVDAWSFREFVYAVDPSTMTLLWQVPLAELLDQGINSVPPYRLVPAPVSLGSTIAAASTVSADLQILDAANGSLSTSIALDAACQASPIVANARLVALSRSGTLYSFEGTHPQPASASSLTPSGAHLGASPATLSWAAGPPGAAYTVRLAQDGEILMDWDLESVVGTPSISCPVLPPDHLYTWAVRLKDASGASAPWSVAQFAQGSPPQPPSGLVAVPRHARVVLSWAPSPSPDATGYRVAYGLSGGPLGPPVDVGAATTAAVDGLVIGTSYSFEVTAVNTLGFVSSPVGVTATPISTISFGGTLYATIADALAAAHSGDVVPLAADVYFIGATLQLPAGVMLQGVNARDTRIVAGAAVPMIDAATGAAVQGIGLSGGSIGIAATGQAVEISHCVIAGMSDAGIDVPGLANVTNNTIVGNTNAGIRAGGRALARNNIIQGNGTGLVGVVLSKYNDVSDGYSGSAPGEGDLSSPVLFVDPASGDYRERSGQPSLDAGAPGDSYSNEPAPNGFRINMGAFGNTSLAAASPEGSPAGPAACGLLGLEALLGIALLSLRRR